MATPRTPKAPSERVFPDPVIEAWNDEIDLRDKGVPFTVSQEHMVLRITKAMDCDRRTVYDERWLDIEELFGNHGWVVTYSKPDWGDSDPPTFHFRRKSDRPT